jgi:hypothetical protein
VTCSPENPPTSRSPSSEPSLPTCCMHANTVEHRMRRHATRGVQPTRALSSSAQTFPPVPSGDHQLNRLCPSLCTAACQQINVAPSLNLLVLLNVSSLDTSPSQPMATGCPHSRPRPRMRSGTGGTTSHRKGVIWVEDQKVLTTPHR